MGGTLCVKWTKAPSENSPIALFAPTGYRITSMFCSGSSHCCTGKAMAAAELSEVWDYHGHGWWAVAGGRWSVNVQEGGSCWRWERAGNTQSGEREGTNLPE